MTAGSALGKRGGRFSAFRGGVSLEEGGGSLGGGVSRVGGEAGGGSPPPLRVPTRGERTRLKTPPSVRKRVGVRHHPTPRPRLTHTTRTPHPDPTRPAAKEEAALIALKRERERERKYPREDVVNEDRARVGRNCCGKTAPSQVAGGRCRAVESPEASSLASARHRGAADL